ncbi:head-tail joining protein [Vreelandella populi]|uniref:head-tail joining protein n=1 Tax=Vreelandella populi TaxID=2498858 RepID=UPI000F8F4B58|nr:hypothetical protein [Halomonas populi]RUR51415.1 hypothetical protein ELY40_16585 [Halomonas populi]
MSVFDDEVRSDITDIFYDAGFVADYRSQAGVLISGVWVVIDRDWESYSDDQQLAGRITTISVMTTDIARSDQGDTVITPAKTWTVEEVVADDGHIRRLWVT